LLDRSSLSSFQHSQIGSPDACCSTRGEVNTPLRLEGKLVLKRKKKIKEENAEEGKRRPVVSLLFNASILTIFSLLEERNVNSRCDILTKKKVICFFWAAEDDGSIRLKLRRCLQLRRRSSSSSTDAGLKILKSGTQEW
jgi:hypothetical protein